MQCSAPLHFLLGIVLCFTACKKDDDAPEGPNGGGAPPVNELPAAFLTATILDEPSVGKGFAVFLGADTQFTAMTSVQLNGEPLTDPFGYGVHVTSDTADLDLSTATTTWTVEGANGFPSFMQNVNGIAFPQLDPIASPHIVGLSEGYTLSTTSVEHADSVIFVVGNVRKALPGNATTCHFSPADLSVHNTNGPYWIATIAASTYQEQIIYGVRVHFSKERAQRIPIAFVE